MAVINLIVPASWDQLTQQQLRYACFLLSSGHYTREQVEALTLIRWSKCLEGHVLPAPDRLAPFLTQMEWLFNIPDTPVRLEEIHRAKAVHPMLRGVPFEHWLILENTYQGYLRTKQQHLIENMTPYLYGHRIPLSAAEAYSIFLWMAAVKRLFAARFPHFFLPSPVTQEEPEDMHNSLRRNMNMQIRALTKGDITKEKEILAMDTWRALTELDAQAEEYEQIKKIHSHAK